MLFGPLDISYCLLFYLLSIGNLFICFGLFILFIVNLKNFKKLTEISFLLILFFILFFENRLLYSMCSNDIKIEIIESNETLNNIQSVLDQISSEQKSQISKLSSLNTGISDVSTATTTTLNTNKKLLEYIKEQGDIWRSKYPTIQINMDVIEKKLNTISKNTKPLQYSYITNTINK